MPVSTPRTSFMSTDDGEIFITNTEREYNVRCSLSGTQDVIATNYYGFIDLSDTVNWPHIGTSRLDFTSFSLNVDKATSAKGSVAIGIITRIDGTDADVVYILGIGFTQNGSENIFVIQNFSPSQIKTNVTGGKLAQVKTNTVQLNIAAINTGTPLAFGPGGATFIPAVGDAILTIITTTGGTLSWGLATDYHAHPVTGA